MPATQKRRNQLVNCLTLLKIYIIDRLHNMNIIYNVNNMFDFMYIFFINLIIYDVVQSFRTICTNYSEPMQFIGYCESY